MAPEDDSLGVLSHVAADDVTSESSFVVVDGHLSQK